MSHCWTVVDVDAGYCTAEQLGQPRPLVEVLDAVQPDSSPESMRRVAFNALVRLAQQNNDLQVAYKAALALLDRAALLPQPQESPPSPEWLTARRLAYQAGDYADPSLGDLEPFSDPIPSLPPADPGKTPPSIAGDPARPLPDPQPAPRLQLVEPESQFFASPTRRHSEKP